MSKRKKKGRSRKERTISAFGLRGMADQYEAAPLYQRKFQPSDMAWLGEKYQRQCSSDSAPTLEEFSAQYGVSVDELRFHLPEEIGGISSCVTLWHGTTRSRAESIRREGFRLKRARNRRRIFFAGRSKMAQGVARNRARNEGDRPAVIMCSIDLSHYNNYEQRGNAVYMFGHECIASEVIERVTVEELPELPSQPREKPKKREVANVELTNVTLTFNSGRAGIAYWVNSYLKLDGCDGIDEDHETVVKIKQWLDAEADSGRFGEVPDDEVVEQTQEYLPQCSP